MEMKAEVLLHFSPIMHGSWLRRWRLGITNGPSGGHSNFSSRTGLPGGRRNFESKRWMIPLLKADVADLTKVHTSVRRGNLKRASRTGKVLGA